MAATVRESKVEACSSPPVFQCGTTLHSLRIALPKVIDRRPPRLTKIPCVGTSTPSVDFGAVEDGEQVGEKFVGFVVDAVEDVGDGLEAGVGVAAGDDAAVVVVLVDIDRDRGHRVLV